MLNFEVLSFVLVVIIAWVGGSHTGMRQCRELSNAFQASISDNSQLRKRKEERDLEFMKLQNRVYQLENELQAYKQIYTQEINDLSAKVVWLREQLELKNTTG